MRLSAGQNGGMRQAGALLLSLAVFLMVAAVFPPLCPGDVERHVLVLHSYHQGYRWTDDLTRGIEASLRGDGAGVRLHYEYMDTKRVSGPAYFRLLYATYRYKFSRSRFDAIIATDNDAFDFLLAYRDELFPGTPVVFCGVNDFTPSQLRGARLFTGVNEAADIKATLDLALRLHPRARRVVVINDTTTTGRVMHKQIADLVPSYRGKATFTFLEDLTMPELQSAVEKLPPDALVFYTFFFRDSTGKFYEYDEGISLIAQRCRVPIYGVWDFYLGHGMVGGMLTSGYYQGNAAGAMVTRILHGESAGNMPVVMQSPNRYMFDYQQLRRFGIALSSLPQGSIIVNRPVALRLYAEHRTLFWGVSGAFAALMVIILLLLRTMTIRRRAAEELRRAAVKYRVVADNTYDWEFWEDPEGRFVYSSPSCECITEHGAEEFLSDPGLLRRIIHPDDLARFDQHRADVVQKMCPDELQFRIVLPGGGVRWMDHQCLPVFDDSGEFLGTRGSNRDITQRRLADEALRESEERYRALFEGANDAIVTVRDGVFVDCNRKALEMFRCAAGEFLGRSPAYFSPSVQPDGSDSGERIEEKIAAALGGIPQFFEWQHRRCDETLFQGEVSLSRMECRGEGELLAIVRDITERKAMERMKDEVISAVSHEMRTPLTAMLGFTEFLMENKVDSEIQQEYLGIVHHETERLSELIGNFLDLQRMKAQQTVYQFRPLMVRPLLEEAAVLFSGASHEHRITIQCPDEMPLVLGDEMRLHQVLNNLLSNAIKYSPGHGEIILGARREEDGVVLWVRDEGMGIAPEVLDKIFERFYRVDSTDRRSTGGTGLGLALVREIVLAHGGRVLVESTVGKGSTFYVFLPIARGPAAAETEAGN
ncbi:MAG TPA: ABC transporter substrate binding protein [Geobacteraceae bacterium]